MIAERGKNNIIQTRKKSLGMVEMFIVMSKSCILSICSLCQLSLIKAVKNGGMVCYMYCFHSNCQEVFQNSNILLKKQHVVWFHLYNTKHLCVYIYIHKNIWENHQNVNSVTWVSRFQVIFFLFFYTCHSKFFTVNVYNYNQIKQ